MEDEVTLQQLEDISLELADVQQKINQILETPISAEVKQLMNECLDHTSAALGSVDEARTYVD